MKPGRDVRGRGGFEAGAAGVEQELKRLVPAAVPPGLRQRVLAGAAEARRGALLAPWMRVTAAVCSILIGTVLAIDPLLSGHEEARLTTLLNGRSAAAPTNGPASEFAEVLSGQGTEVERMIRIQSLATFVAPKDMERDYFEARERLKGWLEYETSEAPD